MNRIYLFPLIIFAVFVSLACPGNNAGNNDDDYERIVPPVPDEVDESAVEEEPEWLLEELKRQVEEKENEPFVMFNYLNQLERANKIDEAMEFARELGKIEVANPFRAVTYLKFARMVLDKVPLDVSNREELVEEAIDGLNTALLLEPSNIPVHEAMGRLMLEKGEYDKALEHLSIALTVLEIGYNLRIEMAKIYIERNMPSKAKAHLEAAKPLAQEADDTDALREINALLSQVG